MSADEAMRYLIQESMVDIFVEFCRKQLGVAPAKEYVFHPVRKWRFDYAFPDAKIAEIQEIQEIQEIALSAREKKIIERLNAKSNRENNRKEAR